MRHWGTGVVLLTATVLAERLPVQVYTPADGLPGIAVHRVSRDAKGFLWFCTNEGVSRFDGYGFAHYGRADGLPNLNVFDLLETRDGAYWIGTAEGLCRRDSRAATPESRFERYVPPGGAKAQWINKLMEDRAGRIWVGTEGGLFRLERVQGGAAGQEWRFQAVELPLPREQTSADHRVSALLCDRRGSIWVGSISGIYLLRPDRIERYSTANGLPHNFTLSLTEDSRGRVWAGTSAGLCRLVSDPAPGHRIVERVYTSSDGLPGNGIKVLLPADGGRLWVGTRGGLAELLDRGGSPPQMIRAYTTAHGLSDADIHTLEHDQNGNLWIGTNGGGAVKLARNGFITYDREDGLGATHVVALFEDQDRQVCVVTKSPGRLFLQRFDGRRFQAVALRVPAEYYDTDWLGWYQVVVHSRNREWWAASLAGVLRFPAVHLRQLARSAPLRRYDTTSGLHSNQVHQIFEDSHGRLWISTRTLQGNAIALLDPSSDSIYQFSEADGLPSLREMRANGFFEDRAGQIWIGLHRAGVLRYVRGRFQTFQVTDGVPPGGIRRFHQDQQGRLWLGSGQGGLARVDDPRAARPSFVTYDTSHGLSGNEIQAITEDQWGRIYVGTGDWVDRLDPATGKVRRFTTADGLAPGEIQAALRDRNGTLWFGTIQGVSRLTPVEDPPAHSPPIRIVAVRVGGVEQSVPDDGGLELMLPDVRAQRNHIQVDFVGLSFMPGDVLRYQYRLEGAEPEWSRPATQRSVIYAQLAPGRYRFWVRALNAEGVASPSPAVLAFRVLPPLWMRWWFLVTAVTVAASILYGAHRYRLRQLLAIQRLRISLASDLHDEVGSGLSQIAVLSEVAKDRLTRDPVEATAPLARIAEISRELIDSVSDMVWVINVQRDRLGDLTQRMRRFAAEMFSAGGIEFEFQAVDLVEDQKIDLDTRRQIYLIFREMIRNIVRHSGCSRAAVHLSCANGLVVMRVTDDGIGFDPAGQPEGQGLKSIRERARSLDGRIEWEFASGTAVILKVPLPK